MQLNCYTKTAEKLTKQKSLKFAQKIIISLRGDLSKMKKREARVVWEKKVHLLMSKLR